MNVNRYFVAPCDEGDGRRTWDVLDRLNGDAARFAPVFNASTRQEARKVCWGRNAEWNKKQRDAHEAQNR